MIKEREYHEDEKTILPDHQRQVPAQGPLADFAGPPRFEQLEERMIYAVRLCPGEAFNVSLNPLAAAASELLSEVVRLKHSTVLENLAVLEERLTSAMKPFEFHAVQGGVENSRVMTARYVLCTVIDEAVVTTLWGNESERSKISLLSSFHNETFGGEKFFQLLGRLLKNPVKHLPMLELMYLCLALGFEGKCRVTARGVLDLDGIPDALYRQVRQLCGDVSRELSPHWQGLNDQRRDLVRIVSWWMVALFTLICLVVMYSRFAWVLGEQRDTVPQLYQSLDAAAGQPGS